MMVTKKAHSLFVKCDSWDNFVQFSKHPRIVVYNFRVEEGAFHVYAIKERVFAYKETLPFPQKTEITKNRSKWKFKSDIPHDENQLEHTGGLVIFSRQPLQKKFRCGIPYSVTPKLAREKDKWTIKLKSEFSPETVIGFLSEALKVSRDRVIEGDVYGL